MVNVVMIARGRARLTCQATESLRKHTKQSDFTLTLVDDGTMPRADEPPDVPITENILQIRLHRSKGIVGLARNIGIAVSERYWGRDDLLYLSDNDAYFTQGWLDKLLDAWAVAQNAGFQVLGGYNHPYHGIAGIETDKPAPVIAYSHGEIREYYALGGFSWLLSWDTWDKFGPFDAHMAGVCKSEDFAFCQAVRAAGGKIGALWPHIVFNAGLTNTFGEKAVGHEAMPLIPGIVME